MEKTWVTFAVLGAGFAGVVSILAKKGLATIDSGKGVAIQCAAMLVTVLGLVTLMRRWSAEGNVTGVWWMTAAGVAAGFAWVFGYRALQLAEVSKTAPLDKLSLPVSIVLALVFLSERPGGMQWVGIALIVAGSFVIAAK